VLGVLSDQLRRFIRRTVLDWLVAGKLKIWLKEVRAPFLTASTAPVLLGSAVAYSFNPDVFSLWYFILVLIGGICLHIWANVVNDYYDYKSGTDNINVEYVRPFTGGSRVIQEGLMTPREVFVEAMVFFAIGGIIGLYLAFQDRVLVIVLGFIGAFSGFFYTAPPVDLAKRGIGELFIGLNFGILMTLGAYYVQIGSLAWEPVLAAVPVSILIATLLYINEFQDYAADKAAGKKHLVVRLGKKKAAKGHAVLLSSVYVYIGVVVALGLISPFSMIAFLTLPLAITSIRFSRDFYSDSFKIVPANVSTIQCHIAVGLLMTLGYLLASNPVGTWYVFIVILVVSGLLMFRSSNSLERAREAPPPAAGMQA
jgi:1,4-dihydroxy-2-naphthoate octaprenyltransferase